MTILLSGMVLVTEEETLTCTRNGTEDSEHSGVGSLSTVLANGARREPQGSVSVQRGVVTAVGS